jgi:hypothetical protein
MSVARLRAPLVYLALVGLPVAGLIGVLRAGTGLEAPPAIAGEWVLEAGAASTCAGTERIAIEQSGRFLQVRSATEGSEATEAHLDGARLAATLRPAEGPCAGAAVALEGSFADGVLEGQLSTDACPPCASTPLRARRAVE